MRLLPVLLFSALLRSGFAARLRTDVRPAPLESEPDLLHALSLKPTPVIREVETVVPSFFQWSKKVNHSKANQGAGLSTSMDEWRQDVFQRAKDMSCGRRAQAVVAEGNATRCLWSPDRSASPTLMDISEPAAKADYITSIPTYYITMGGERKDTWLKKYARFTSNLNVVEAVRGSQASDVEPMVTRPYASFFHQNRQFPMNPGVLGCTLSHMKSIKAAYDAGHDLALILEDDAVPDLSPWWPQSLESYAKSLPDGWQLSQLSWTTQAAQAPRKYAKNDGAAEHTQFFSKGTGWGTVAYLISRQGMERVLSQLWDAKADKFNVDSMLMWCPYFTADDCLLSCSNFPDLMSKWLPGKHSMMDQTYKATPPLFTSYMDHHSLQKEAKDWVISSFCDDIESNLQYSEEACAARAAGGH